MENQSFDPKNPVYPPGCHGVTTPNKVNFRDTNTTGKPELNFNKFSYFTPTGANGALQMLSDQTIRDIIRSPESPWELKLQGMVMIGPSGIPIPAHLPNLVDNVGTINIAEVFDKLNNNNLSYKHENISEVVPTVLEDVIDPCPKVEVLCPVYPLTARKVVTEMACYSDGFQVYYIHANLTEIMLTACAGRFRVDRCLRHIDVTLDCKYKQGRQAFDLGSSIVLWNARGVTRPSFRNNAINIVNVHKPIIFIITEARVGRKLYEEVVKAFPYEVDWQLDESVGNSGGVAVIWDGQKVASSDFIVAAMADCPVRVLGWLKPSSNVAGTTASAAAAEGEGEGA